MYVVAIFALALLSPLPFISPFVYDAQNVEAQLSSSYDVEPNTDTSSISTNDLAVATLTSSSNNTNNPAYAKAGDTITISFTADNTLHYNATATIHGKDASVSIFDNTLSATITVLETDPDGYANFTINVSNDFGSKSVLSDANLTSGTTVYVDKHVPVIRINGPHLVYVTQGESYTEFGASVTDTDPIYSNGNLAIDSTSVNTGTIGTYTVVYTADADGAGNEPFSKTRTVSVEKSSLSLEASYVDTETILLRFDTSATAYYSGPNDLVSGIQVDGIPVKSAYIPAQIRSVTTLDSTIPDLDFLIDFSQFGFSVANMGDLNQDGHEDIIVGVPRQPSLTDKGGAVAILYLDDNAQILDVFLFDGDTPNMPPLLEQKNRDDNAERFGNSVDNLGDVNGDGFADIIVGTPTRNFGASTYGGAYVLFLGPNGSSVLGYAEINHTLPNGPRHIGNSQFGWRVLSMGDLNNDGIGDAAVSAVDHRHTDPATNVTTLIGAVYLMHLGSDGLPIKTIDIDIAALEAQFPSILPAGNTRTWAIENMGDLNGDGFTDMMMTSSYSVVVLENETRIVGDNFIYILHLGENGETVLDFNQISMHDGNLVPTPFPAKSINYGDAIQNIGDVNGDGYTDILMSAPTALDPTVSHRNGLLHVIFLGPDGTSVLGYYEINAESIMDLDLVSEGFAFQNQSEIGGAISVLGDINSDGALDIIVSSTKFVGIHERKNDGQGALHVISLAGPGDNVPHVVVKPNANASTNQSSSVTFNQAFGKLQLRSLSPTAIDTVSTVDKSPPEISSVTTLTNQSLEIVFSEDIDTDTEFGITNFRVSDTDQHISITGVSNPTANTVLLNVNHISSLDEPLVEIFNSTIKDTEGNVIKYTAHTTESTIGTYPLSAFWGYDFDGNPNIAPVVFILFETAIQENTYPANYLLNITTNVTAQGNPFTGSALLAQDELDQYEAIRFNHQFGFQIPLALNDTGVEITLAPNDAFLDAQGDQSVDNYTLPVETFQPPKILYAETSEGRFITLVLNRYVEDVNTTDFSVSDSLSVQNVSVDGNKIILDVTSMSTDSTPTVTIIDTIKDKNNVADDITWYNFVQQTIVNGTQIDAIDGSYPTILTAEYDGLYTVNITYSEPLDISTIDKNDFEMFYLIDDTVRDFVFATTVKKITNLDTAADGLSSVLTFDRKLNPSGTLRMVGSIHDTLESAMLYQNVILRDSIPPTMSFAKTINSTLIEIEFNEPLDTSSVDSSYFTVSDSIVVSGTIAFDNVVLLTTSTILEGATPTITLSGSVSDPAGNIANSASLVATDGITPSLSSLSIISNNANTEFAKSGDQITLTLVANEDVSIVDGTILETAIQPTGSDNSISTTVDIATSTSNGKPTFTITIADDAGNSKTITHSDITGTTVVVDTLAPAINLNGLETTTLILGKTFTDEGAVVIDNDPNYAESATTASNNINNAQLGSYEVTYSAQPDSAGNVPVTKTRSVTVIDADPITVTSLSIVSSSGDNFANEGRTITVTLETDGSDLGNFTGTLLGRPFIGVNNSGTGTFTTNVLSTDASYANATFSISVTNSSGNVIDVTTINITDSSFVTIDTAKPIITLNGNSPYTTLQGEPYADPGTDVSDPDNPSYTGTASITTNLDTSSLGAQNITYSAPADAAGNVPDPINRTVTVLAKPLGIDTLTITSTNSENSLYATTGDEITITLDANGTIGSATTISIASISLQYTLVNDRLTTTYVVNSSLADTTNLGFTITAYNEDNTTSRTFTATNLNGSNIIIDKTSPTIVLEGINNTIVPTNSSYTDAGATASDPSYASNIPVTGTSTNFDVTQAGNYTFTYTAPDDEAGNPGPSITRNVVVKDTPPIGITTFSISTTNTGYAKAGDEINFFLLVNNTIDDHTFQIPNTTVTNERASGNELYIDVQVLNNATESNATFTITIENVNGTSLTITEDDLTSSNVFIDTIPPRIATDDGGPADYFIVNGTDPTIRNVTVTDGDLNYSGNYTLVTPNGPVNADINGSVYNYTYTADDDNAGNPGDRLTRIITIVDADPIIIRSLSIGSDSNNNFANAGKTITVTLETDGSDLGNFTVTMLGRSIAKTDVTSGATTFETIVLSDDPNGKATFSIVATNSSGNRIFVTDLDTNDSSSVIIDTVKPTIELITNPTVEVFEGETYADLSVTVSDDTDSSYSPTITATTLDTSVLGAQNITYSATADAAGNVPDPINRTVTVLAKPLGIDTLTITSTNSKNSLYATTGDELTITLDANGTISSTTTISIASIPLQYTLVNDRLTATYVVDSSLVDTTNLGFTITAYNEDNTTSRTFTATNLDGSNIIIDKTSPTIALEGINNTIVPTNGSYTDAGATASDPSYASNIPVTGTSTDFNINKSGDYTFTYTAPDDAAGNPGPSITRNVMVKDIPPIGIDTFTIETNTGYAKAGDVVNFYLLVNNTIASYTFQMPNANITNDRESGNELYIDIDVLNNATESNATFTITIENVNGTSLTITEDDLTSSNVFIDTIPPRIATDDGGPADYSIVNGTDPTIRNVTVTDGDLNYSGNYTLVTPNGPVNADINGSVYNYTYTADDDNAGNPGPSLSRIITIIDADPITIRSLSIASNSGNNFANEGKTIIVTLETDGSDLGNFTVTMLGRSIAKADVTSGATTFETNVLSDDPNGKATFSITATNSSGNRIFVTDLDTNDSSSVIIDTVKPTIELITNPTVEVFEGETYADLGVTVSDDTDSSYSPTITATTLDTSVLGAQNITYSATADAAGNVPDPINRTVTVLAKPLGIDTLTITSTNSKNSLYATTDDEITITLDANGTIGSATTIQIESIQLTPIFTNDRLTASYTVDSSLADTINLGFTITAYNEDNKTSRTFTATNLDGSNIIIDKTSPTIALEGINNTIVPTNSSYTDAGATASDPSYANNIPVTGTSTNFDVTQAGNYTFTYTAPDDAAGNPGPSITRNVMVKDIPPIGIDTFTIESNTGYAKAGDLINFYLLVNNTIASYTFQMPNANITNDRESGNELYIDIDVLNNATESNATFTITIENVNGTSLTITEDDLTASNVFIDTIPPRIATDDGGPADYFLVNGTENPTIRNVTVTDGDLNYSGNYTLVTPNGPVNADINGSVYNYTYTADDDNAGNPGPSLTRIITIIDAPLIDITSLSITSSPGNPNFANADNTITLRLQTDSDDLGNFTGTLLGKEFTNTTSGGTATFTVPVSSSDANGNVTFSIVVTNSSGGRVSFTESDLDTDSFVTIDTISPTISLNGENDTVVALGEPYTYLGATAYDLSYGNIPVSTTDRVNVNQLGHYTLHYTAPTDAAGNTGPTIIQIVEVLDAPPIDIQTFTIRNGGDSSSLYAKAGDDLSIQLSINYTIASYTATIFGIEQSESNQNSNGFLISQQVPYDLAIEENATFSITIVDENGLPNTITQNTLITSSQLPPDNIFIDTISPIVELSTQQISISVNDTIPDITATITEGDPNYGEKTITIPGSNISASDDVDIGTVGAYVFTYTARDDTAGNPGQSATISIVVKNATLIDNRTTILSSSVIKDAPQSFSDDIIIAEIHNDDGDSNNTLSLNAPIVELDVSDITNTAPGANNYITTYTHPIDLTVHNTISAQIELGTVLEFNTDDTTIRHNFTIHYVENDDPNDDVIRIGHTDINYELDTHAIGITFERVRTPFNVSITNPSGVYVPVKSFEFTTTTENSANAWDILDGDSTYSGTLYTYDKSTRTVTVWTSHLSDVRLNSTSSSGGDESDSNSPTLGKASSGAQLVTNGFEYNGLTVNVGRYHTEFPLIGTNVGDINTIKMKVYDSAGPTGVKRVEFALGVPDIGLYHEAEAFVEVWMQRDSVAVQETIIVDELNLLENSDVSATVSQTSCSGGEQQCLLVELQYSYREPPAYNTISIKPVDWDNNAHQFYFNDGIHVDGDSINLPKEITISASHAADTTHAGETLHLVQIDRAEHLWVDQYGYQWMIIGNTVRQITVPEYLVPNDNTYGTLHGPDRNHPEFASSVYAEQQKAQETLAEILGHATIMKPLPENGGTIYFDATGTDSRSGDSFKLLLELETARMHQLSNLLYDDTS